VVVILTFFVVHGLLSIFFQSLFLHRYGAHRHFTMSRGWERVFYLGTFITQGASFLMPRAYALVHREHHAFSDTARDPHSPHIFPDLWRMMWATKVRYAGFVHRTIEPEARWGRELIEPRHPRCPRYQDVPIDTAKRELGFQPRISVDTGADQGVGWLETLPQFRFS
jgi:stearoyl-CoA desaturase (Delta-9 desaturase)